MLLLQGKKIVITRAQEQSLDTYALFRELGAVVVDLPALIISPPSQWESLDHALNELGTFQWIVFSSANGVRSVETRMQQMGLNLSSFSESLKIAAVGKKTASCLEQLGVRTDFIPPSFVADSLIQYFPVSVLGLRILIPRVESGGRPLLANEFKKKGADVVEVPAYDSLCPNEISKNTLKLFSKGEVDAITFTSGKTAIHTARLLKKHFGEAWLDTLGRVKIISIGPQTSLQCEKYLGRCDIEADPHDLQGLINACIYVLTS